jgi:hypothetical protein
MHIYASIQVYARICMYCKYTHVILIYITEITFLIHADSSRYMQYMHIHDSKHDMHNACMYLFGQYDPDRQRVGESSRGRSV